MNNERLLNEEIQYELEQLKKEKLGSEEYTTVVDSVVRLMDRSIEMEKINIDRDLKVKELEEEKKDRLIKNIISGVIGVGGLVGAAWGTVVSLNWEKEGTITSQAGRKHLNKILSLFK